MAILKQKEAYVKATSEGRLYIETSDFFKSGKVQKMVSSLMKSDIYKGIEERNAKAHTQPEETGRKTIVSK